jgi:hypothetical protein
MPWTSPDPSHWPAPDEAAWTGPLPNWPGPDVLAWEAFGDVSANMPSRTQPKPTGWPQLTMLGGFAEAGREMGRDHHSETVARACSLGGALEHECPRNRGHGGGL